MHANLHCLAFYSQDGRDFIQPLDIVPLQSVTEGGMHTVTPVKSGAQFTLKSELSSLK